MEGSLKDPLFSGPLSAEQISVLPHNKYLVLLDS